MGNHELMAVKCMDLLCEEITTETIKRLDHSFVENLLIWQENGGYSTIDELRCCDAQTKNDLIEYISDTANPALLRKKSGMTSMLSLAQHQTCGKIQAMGTIREMAVQE